MKALSLLVLGIAAAQAGETTIEPKPFRIERSFPATLLPAGPVLLAVDPDAWTDFTIARILPHGTPVKKGDTVVAFETEALERKLEDQRRSVGSKALALATQELAFAKLEEETALKLEAARRSARIAAEDLAHFTSVGREARQEEAKDNLEGARQRRDGAREELTQLKKMYEADDVTEETEEIILKRQQYAVESSELRLRLTELSTKRELETTLPRQLEALTAADRNARIELEKAEKDLPRGLETAKIALDGAKSALEREQSELKELEADLKLMTVIAPEDGVLYHGSMEDGRWTLGELAKSLVKGGRVPLIRPFATIVPSEPDLALVAHVEEAVARSLSADLKGGATAGGREDIAFTATVVKIAGLPGADGRYRVDLEPEWEQEGDLEWPADLDVAAGMNLECRFIVHQNPDAITLPVKALRSAPEGAWTVDLKLADGKTEARPVRRGRVSGDQVEILSGLEAGQVVVIPD